MGLLYLVNPGGSRIVRKRKSGKRKSCRVVGHKVSSKRRVRHVIKCKSNPAGYMTRFGPFILKGRGLTRKRFGGWKLAGI